MTREQFILHMARDFMVLTALSSSFATVAITVMHSWPLCGLGVTLSAWCMYMVDRNYRRFAELCAIYPDAAHKP